MATVLLVHSLMPFMVSWMPMTPLDAQPGLRLRVLKPPSKKVLHVIEVCKICSELHWFIQICYIYTYMLIVHACFNDLLLLAASNVDYFAHIAGLAGDPMKEASLETPSWRVAAACASRKLPGATLMSTLTSCTGGRC